MRYPGSTWTERSQVRPVSGKTGRGLIRPAFLFRPDGHRPSGLADYDKIYTARVFYFSVTHSDPF